MDTLKSLREQAGLTQAELAAKIGLSESYIQKLETGRRRLSLDNVVKLSEALSLPTATVMKLAGPLQGGLAQFVNVPPGAGALSLLGGIAAATAPSFGLVQEWEDDDGISDQMKKDWDHVQAQLVGEPPVDIVAIARSLGLRVVRHSGVNFWGAIYKEEGRYVIGVNAHHHRVRQRFSVAHELAHFLKHRELIGEGLFEEALYRGVVIGIEMEREANRLAGDFLIPKAMLEAAMDAGTTEPAQLAALFDVSGQAMAIQLGVPYE